MASLVDFFGLLTVIIHGTAITAQSILLGGVVFLAFLAIPLRRRMGVEHAAIEAWARRVIIVSGLAFAGLETLNASLNVALLRDTLGLDLLSVLDAQFVASDGIAAIAALILAGLSRTPWTAQRQAMALITSALALAGVVATSHAASRLDNRLVMGLASFLHQLGGAIWLGGLPCFLFALKTTSDPRALAAIGRRYSLISMTGVAMILLGAIALSFVYIGAWDAALGTAYGAMAMTKLAMFCVLLLLGLGNYFVVERLRRGETVSALRIRRFAEVELGVGIAIFFAAASITSLPPAIDLTEDRVSFHEIVDRMIPVWPPRLESPDRANLSIPRLQAQLDKEWETAQQKEATRPRAFVPGEGLLPPRDATDIGWSEYNHHWAGIMVILIALAALIDRTGRVPIARHWPLLYLVLAVFLFLRSDPEYWPLGHIGFFDGLHDPEVVQHEFFVLLVVAFTFFEWRIRMGHVKAQWPALVFPILAAAGGTALLTHSHAISNIKEQLLIELTHLPLALCAIATGWARWLELRLPGRDGRIAGWLWPVFMICVGVILLIYREA